MTTASSNRRTRTITQIAVSLSEPPHNLDGRHARFERTSCLAAAGRARVGHSCA